MSAKKRTPVQKTTKKKVVKKTTKKTKKAPSRKKKPSGAKEDSLSLMLSLDGQTLANFKSAVTVWQAKEGQAEDHPDKIALALFQQALGEYLVAPEDMEEAAPAAGDLIDLDDEDDVPYDPEYEEAFLAHMEGA